MKSARVQNEVSLPVRYLDGSAAYFYFAISEKKAAKLLEGHYQPAPVAFGRTLLALCFFEYRDTSIGPYNEVGLGITVRGDTGAGWLPRDFLRQPEQRTTGFHVLHLPVTSEVANQAGRDTWGLPKFVTSIPFQLKGRHFEGGVNDPNAPHQPIFTVTSEFGRGLPSKGVDLVLFNDPNEANEKSIVNCQARFLTARCAQFDLTLGRGNHPLLRTLDFLGLDGEAPLLVQYTTHFVAQLHGPTRTK